MSPVLQCRSYCALLNEVEYVRLRVCLSLRILYLVINSWDCVMLWMRAWDSSIWGRFSHTTNELWLFPFPFGVSLVTGGHIGREAKSNWNTRKSSIRCLRKSKLGLRTSTPTLSMGQHQDPIYPMLWSRGVVLANEWFHTKLPPHSHTANARQKRQIARGYYSRLFLNPSKARYSLRPFSLTRRVHMPRGSWRLYNIRPDSQLEMVLVSHKS